MIGSTAMVARLVLFSCVALASACLAPLPERCVTDDECAGAVCSRTGECAPEDALVAVRFSWTLCTATATVEQCQAHDVTALRITFADDDVGDEVTYEPVLCDLGQIYFNRMSPRFDAMEATVLSGSRILDRARLPLQSTENFFEIDFAPRSPTGPSGCAMLRAP